jgi:pre-rRNA-processing protein IPI3
VISSDLSGELHNVMVWDLMTANTLMTYKSFGVIQRHCLDLISDQFIISSQKDTPIINIWGLERKDQLHLKMTCPAKVTALKVTNDGMYCVVAINTHIYIWQVLDSHELHFVYYHQNSL